MTVTPGTQVAMRLPFFVKYIQVTNENMAVVAEWCGGEIIGSGLNRYVLVPVVRPMNKRQTEAYIDCYVLLSSHEGEESFKVYTEEWFAKCFTPLGPDLTDVFRMPDVTVADSFVVATPAQKKDPSVVRSPAPNHTPENVRALPSPRNVRAKPRDFRGMSRVTT